MLTVDANVWVAAFDPTDALHAPSVSFLRYLATRRDSDCAPSFLALEVGCALTRRLARPEAGADDALLSHALRAGTARGLHAADALYTTAVAERTT